MIKRNKKGFTIVELVIVIAIVAILAAILIPTFSSVIDRANESADIQTVRQINVILAAEAIEKEIVDIQDVLDILADYNFTADNLKPAGDNHEFMWDKEKNLIILVEKDGETATLIYPVEEGENTNITSQITQNIIQAIGGGSGGVTTAAELKASLEDGGDVQLGGNVTIETADQAFAIPSGTTTSLDLNGHTLTIAAPADYDDGFENVVQGQLTITDSSNNRGTVVIESSEAINDASRGGFWVYGGTLKLNNVNVEGYRKYNIYDFGPPGYYEFTNVTYTVYGGYGLFSNSGETTVKDCTMIANGDEVCQIYCSDGTTDITSTTFTEGTAFVSYAEKAPIEVYGGTATLNGVTVTLGEATIDAADIYSGPYSFFAGSGSEVIIDNDSERSKDSSFNYIFSCVGDSTSITIYGGTFNDGTNDVPFDVSTTPSTIFIAPPAYKLTQGVGCWIISKS